MISSRNYSSTIRPERRELERARRKRTEATAGELKGGRAKCKNTPSFGRISKLGWNSKTKTRMKNDETKTTPGHETVRISKLGWKENPCNREQN